MATHDPRDDDLIAGINVTPLVDIALVLLVIFLVTAKVLVSPSVAMALPPSATSTDVQSPFTLELGADGAVVVCGEKATNDAAIVARARDAKAKSPDLHAIVRADKSVPHGRVIRAIDLLKQAGISRIAFAVAPGGDVGSLVGP